MRLFDKLFDFIFPRKCAGCNEISENVLCDECMVEWDNVKNEKCADCDQRYFDCKCVKYDFFENGPDLFIYVVPYEKTERNTVVNTIYTLKQKNDKFLFEFLACELVNRLKHYREKGYVITYVPRKALSVSEYGFDQAYELAKRVAFISGMPFMKTLKRRWGGAEQKSLQYHERYENAQGQYKLIKQARNTVEGMKFIVIDDVLTTGATIVECSRVLKSYGAKKVVSLSVARTIRQAYSII